MTNLLYSAKHYQIKSSKDADRAKNEADRAKSYAESLNYDNLLNKNMITNCITEIPQDIKLELADGALTLKAGSKVYIPNGFEADGVTPKFDVVVVASDVTTTPTHTNTEPALLFYRGATALVFELADQSFSGTTAPSGFTYMNWYDTANNLVKRTGDGGATWIAGYSLPIGIYHNENKAPKSIDQVFNGFGYIGSTVYALPGVKCLVPNGRNEDGSLKNIEYTLNNLTLAIRGTNSRFLVLDTVSGEFISRLPYTVFNSETRPENVQSGTQQQYWYNPDSNICYKTLNAGATWEKSGFIVCGYVNTNLDSEVVNSLTTKSSFRAIDHSDRETIVGWGLPKKTRTILTPPSANVSQVFIAPANGYFVLTVRGGSNEAYFAWNKTRAIGFHSYLRSPGGTETHRGTCLACKGDEVDIFRAGVSAELWFIELQGED